MTPLIPQETYHDRFLDGLLNLHALSGDGLIQLPFKGQEVHVGLGLWDQVPDLKNRRMLSTDERLTA